MDVTDKEVITLSSDCGTRAGNPLIKGPIAIRATVKITAVSFLFSCFVFSWAFSPRISDILLFLNNTNSTIIYGMHPSRLRDV